MTRRAVRSGIRAAWFCAILAGAVAAGGALASARPGRSGEPYATWIEARASRVFDRTTPQLRGLQVEYRVDARILLPLGLTSVDLWQIAGVGAAIASYRDCQADSGDVVRAFELFSASDPERARGFDRRGFFREALRVTPAGVAWTAYFGAMTSWPEKTLNDARKSLNGPQPHTYEAIDGLSTPLEARASSFNVATEGRVTDPGALWAAIRPQLETLLPRAVVEQHAVPARPLPALAFLGALQASLRSAAVHRSAPRETPATRVAFTHDGSVRQLELLSISADLVRGRQAVSDGFARRAEDVCELRYRIVNPGFENGEFRLWAELPAGVPDGALAPPLPPLGWEMQLRAYLKLVFARIK